MVAVEAQVVRSFLQTFSRSGDWERRGGLLRVVRTQNLFQLTSGAYS
jgi:hypothetical protein